MSRHGIQLIQGTLELLILQTLAVGEPSHGFGILRGISQATDGALTIEEGALYPALHRMERRGWLESEWGVSDNNRRAKYYALTSAGRKHLAEEQRAWREYVAAVARVMDRQAGAEAS